MSQKQIIKEHLETGRSISCREAINLYGIGELRVFISALKREGVPISKRWVYSRNRYNKIVKFKRYRML